MEAQKKKAIILGATGLTGSELLNLLLNDDRYEEIILLSRSTVGFEHPKVKEFLGNLMNLKNFEEHFKADEVFCCIGTTKSKTPNKEVYRQIDYGIPVAAAELCKKNQIPTFLVVSAMGANDKSKIFYNRTKGEMENAVLALKIDNTYILQPSLIGGKRSEKRAGEWLFKQIMKVGNLLLVGGLEKYRSIQPNTIAQCMVWLANNAYDKIRIESHTIKKLAAK
ncbi:NAD-dependent epimerase/dehydratase family protein [Euzebyella marina]|uniref:NAD-dependent epimerase/dehydratase family protein n=1 Tax=Euzebyella marina TaxID=1761453 RepID=A0A3G2L123_9FLAO|nr:NAD(P)H-binding protein [Euzebyella marina]AYN65921.1 NAD-dependent epimerase/dehydratase family protein [Euzebyella marina]